MNQLAMVRGGRLTAVKTIGFTIALAAAAQVAIPVPGTPVPITLQPMLVLLAGFWLPPTAAVASMLLYLAAGAIGLPVWAPIGLPGVARLLGPTGGYLLSYPVAAWVASVLSQRSASYASRLVAAIAAMAVIYAGGTAQLAIITGGFATVAMLGAAPFAALDLAKCLVAAALGPRGPGGKL